ncbi:MAG: pyrroline-5-carboxylate reductase family protein, partial [Aestuariivirgaceae bacterium]
MNLNGKLVLLGAGKMGGAMLQGWLEGGLPASQIIVLDPAPPPETAELIAANGIAHNPVLESLDPVEIVLAAVKPQIMEDALAGAADLKRHNPLILSIAAGKTIASFEAHFGSGAAVIRSIPNTPAAIGSGITAMAANANVTPAQMTLAESLLSSIGEVVVVDNETLIDAATAVSGSGPAYVFYLTECLAAAGKEAGLPADIAMQLARATVAGAGELMRQSGTPAGTLREN